MSDFHRRRFLGAALACGVSAAAAVPVPKAWPASTAALAYREPTRQPLLAATMAGRRVVAVGLRGVVVSSDDGLTFRQAPVPVSSDLTALCFVDDNFGWAVGNDGVVLATRDGGKSWALQRQAFGTDERLFSVMFTSRFDGLAVGAFGLCLVTGDGGTSWTAVDVAREGANAPHLYQLLPGRADSGVIVGEFGSVFVSTTPRQWRRVTSPVTTSLFAGATWGEQLVAVGLNGAAVFSQDGGATWRHVTVANAAHLVGVLSGPAQQLVLIDARGGLLRSCDAGRSFSARTDSGVASPTCGIWHPALGGPQLFSLDGVHPPLALAASPKAGTSQCAT